MYPLPDIDDTYDASRDIPREIFQEASIEANEEQQAAYNEIMSSVDTEDGGLFFVDGPGGTEKTYLYRALLATICSQKKIVVATTTSGVVASIMPRGRTTHSHFKIPLNLDNGSFCSFTKTEWYCQAASNCIPNYLGRGYHDKEVGYRGTRQQPP